VSALSFNPELLRNTRIQLRRGRMLAAVVICAAVSLSLLAYFRLSDSANLTERELLPVVFVIQAAVLVVGGSIYCLQAVQREKDQNTFDFQRITRLTPFQLAVGKVFGAPALTYFVVLCFMPVALWAAAVGGVSLLTLVQVYVILFLGAAAYHCLAVLISMVLERGTSAGAMFFFLWAIGITSVDFASDYQQGPLALRALSPFWAFSLVSPRTAYPPLADSPYAVRSGQDLFFGSQVPHAAVLVVIYLTLIAWFLLALVRNIKRDPSVYEIYRPAQGLGFALYLSFLLIAFFRWTQGFFAPGPLEGMGSWEFRPTPATEAESVFLGFSLVIFICLGLALLRNRDRARRRLREFGGTAVGWWAAIWPAPFLAGGVSLAGAAIIGMIRYNLEPQPEWSLSLGVLQVAVVAAWLARDFVYLQWMNLRRARRPLITGILYLVIFYVCAGVVLGALGLFDQGRASMAAIFIPSTVFGLDAPAWLAQRPQWIGALSLLLGQALAFAWLQRRELQQLSSQSSSVAPEIAPPRVSA
jgi:hypothetical protein